MFDELWTSCLELLSNVIMKVSADGIGVMESDKGIDEWKESY